MEGLKMGLQVENMNKSYNGKFLFNNFQIEFFEGTITCILGPSGCGKTTLLNIIGKIIPSDSGNLLGFDDKEFSYIFQDPRLLPWKTVRGNIEFVLSRDLSAGKRKAQAEQLIRLVELEGFAGYYPLQLSGGMRQRVSIARAFASPSDIILMDEPLTGLDIALKQNLIQWFSQIWKSDRRTVIFVTHDVDEALLLGNEIVVLSKAPAQIIVRENISEPVGNRNLEESHLKKMKQVLQNALGRSA
ncbi:MAG: ATP-binding cassette domain-containing protein [Mariniphaga sp.]|nr:ATP-binding cassette domain-containing protein [Mariniphaga sp.]